MPLVDDNRQWALFSACPLVIIFPSHPLSIPLFLATIGGERQEHQGPLTSLNYWKQRTTKDRSSGGQRCLDSSLSQRSVKHLRPSLPPLSNSPSLPLFSCLLWRKLATLVLRQGVVTMYEQHLLEMAPTRKTLMSPFFLSSARFEFEYGSQ